MNYAKYKELGKALSIRAFGVSELENAVFLFKNAVFSRKNGVFQPGVFDFVLKSAVFRFSDGETCVKFCRNASFTFLLYG